MLMKILKNKKKIINSGVQKEKDKCEKIRQYVY